MITQKDCFLDLKIESIAASIVKEYTGAISFKYIPEFEVIRCLNLSSIKERILREDPFLRKVFDKFGCKINAYNWPANSVYEWHTDYRFNCCLVTVFDEYDSLTFFKGDMVEKTIPRLFTLKYKPLNWYALNVKQEHEVVNFGDKDRILLRGEILIPTTYHEFLDWFEGEYNG
jgi:hypothetical protein